MPYFSTEPRTSLGASLRRLVAGGQGLDPMQAIAIDQAAAGTAHKLAQTDELRQKTALQKKLDELRSDPAQRDAFASHVSGVDLPTGRRIGGNLRGEMEPWSQGDQADADAAGVELKPYRMAAPNVENRIVRGFQDANAALIANEFGGAKSNAQQIMHAVQRTQDNRIAAAAAEAAARGDVSQVNLLSAGVLGKKALTPFKTDTHGITTDEYTGTRDETGPFAGAARRSQDALATERRARAGAHSAHADLYKAQTGKTQAETRKIVDDAEINGDASLAGRAFFGTTGVKLSAIAPEARLAWIKNHAAGMEPAENLAGLMPKGGTDVLMREARQAYETMYPKTMMGQRDPRAPNFLDFADQYIGQKQGGERVPQMSQGRIRGVGRASAAEIAAAPRPKTDAELAKLPRGALFIDPDDGQPYRKP